MLEGAGEMDDGGMAKRTDLIHSNLRIEVWLIEGLFAEVAGRDDDGVDG